MDEDYFYRPPAKIRLRKGWNEVLVKAPHNGEWKWVFTFIPVQATGSGFNVREVPGLRYNSGFEGAEAEEFARALADADAATEIPDDDGFGAPCLFSDAAAGPLREFASTHGIWTAEPGHAAIIDPQPGRRLLKIEGGKTRSVQLHLPDVETIDGLSLDLRRWTRNNPFDLAIDAQVDGEWKPIARLKTADMKGRIEHLRFPAIQAKGLRFTLTSPDHGGLMLDRLRLRAAQP